MNLSQTALQSRPSLVVSIVSHGHGALVQRLLEQLARRCADSVRRVVLTHNVPEELILPPSAGWPFELEVRWNQAPMGFGANHNRALSGGSEHFVCVLNPDVILLDDGLDPFDALVAAATPSGVGCAYPVQLDEEGQVQDSEREVPTPLRLLQRRLLGRRETRAEWVNAACLLVPRRIWNALGGFDERYFMYCEDVDFCLRLRLRGLRLVRAKARIVHAGQRASGRRAIHLAWHVRSIFRLWRSPVYRQAQQLLTSASAGSSTIGTP
ncbi:glycosyl transferase [Acidovorax sp.]|uniref:glycosyl transferase n=1 Tax=Acidovorax sp. TaxID=1872122 RepID=UPI00391C4666